MRLLTNAANKEGCSVFHAKITNFNGVIKEVYLLLRLYQKHCFGSVQSGGVALLVVTVEAKRKLQ